MEVGEVAHAAVPHVQVDEHVVREAVARVEPVEVGVLQLPVDLDDALFAAAAGEGQRRRQQARSEQPVGPHGVLFTTTGRSSTALALELRNSR